jgi:ElaB/YqjD/DUF883 family membrane-anchored ribosome-binding protein
MGEATTNFSGSKVNDAAQRGQMSGRAGYGSSKLGQAADELKQDVGENVGELTRKASEAYQHAAELVTEKVDGLRRQGKEVMRTAESAISKQPITSLAVALGVGALFGLGVTYMFRKQA